jgi:hypothetical protein
MIPTTTISREKSPAPISRVFSSSWSNLWQASKRAPLPVVPARTSRGVPKFYSGADRFPVVEELLVPGWAFSERDDGKVERAYLHQLRRYGVDRIAARLQAIEDEWELQPCIVCFERLSSQCHRSWAARWLGEHGIVVVEIGSLAAKRPTKPGREPAFALCSEINHRTESR